MGHYVKERTKDAQFIIIRYVWVILFERYVLVMCMKCFKLVIYLTNTALETTCSSWLIDLLASIKLTIAPKVSLSTLEVLWCVEKRLEFFGLVSDLIFPCSVSCYYASVLLL